MNITPILAFVYDRKHKATSKRESTVELRITYRRKCKYMSTGVRLLPRHWHNGQVTNRPDARELNDVLASVMSNTRRIISDMMDEGLLSIEEIPHRMERALANRRSFLDFCRERAKVRAYGMSKDTGKRYERFLKFMEDYGKIIYFSDITDAAVIQLDEALKDKGMKNYSKWQNYHRILNSFILDAIDEGYVQRNPYKWVRIVKDKDTGIMKHLTEEELRRIETSVMPTASLERVRDLFVFQTYTCLSYTDLMAFDAEAVGAEDKVYTSTRGKTKQEFTFYLCAKARNILRKYGGRLPAISNEKYNEYLKVVAQTAKVDKPITSHWARHTGATMLLNKGVDMEVIAKILGHASTRQTRNTYARMLDSTVADAMKEYERKLG